MALICFISGRLAKICVNWYLHGLNNHNGIRILIITFSLLQRIDAKKLE